MASSSEEAATDWIKNPDIAIIIRVTNMILFISYTISLRQSSLKEIIRNRQVNMEKHRIVGSIPAMYHRAIHRPSKRIAAKMHRNFLCNNCSRPKKIEKEIIKTLPTIKDISGTAKPDESLNAA